MGPGVSETAPEVDQGPIPAPLRPDERDARAARFALEADLQDHHEERKVEAAAAKLEAPAPDVLQGAKQASAAVWLAVNGLALGTRWERTPAQIEQLVEASAPVVAKYFPTLELGVEATLLVTLAMVYGPTALQWASGAPWPPPVATPPAPEMRAAA